MSHPGAISCRCNLRISRSRRRIRLRRTAVPRAFLMLQPNRLTPRPLGRKKIVNSRLVRRRPSRYTASYSARCTSREARGKVSGRSSDAGEAMASLLAALREYFASTLRFHARAEAVFLVAGAHVRLKCPFRHRSLSSVGWPFSAADCALGYASRPNVNYVVYATGVARSRNGRKEPGVRRDAEASEARYLRALRERLVRRALPSP